MVCIMMYSMFLLEGMDFSFFTSLIKYLKHMKYRNGLLGGEIFPTFKA